MKDEASGVYCGLCILLRQLEVEDAVDVVCTMERIRQQRPAVLTSKVSVEDGIPLEPVLFARKKFPQNGQAHQRKIIP